MRPDLYFDTAHLIEDLRGRTVRGAGVTLVAQGGKFLLQVGSTMILARLLTPLDFGLIAMVVAVTGFVALFKDAGLSMATVQRARIDHDQVSTLFWINLLIGLALAVLVVIVAPAIVWYYEEPRLLSVSLALAPAFLFGGLTVQHEALLRRQMRFRALAGIELVSLSAAVVIAVVLAIAGAGYWALVGQTLTAAGVSASLVWLACGWRPGLPRRNSGVRPMIDFGANLAGFRLINYFARTADNLLIGRYLGAGALGIYGKAYELLYLPLRQVNDPLTAVAVPVLSRLSSEPAAYRSSYRRGITLLVTLGMPIVVLSLISTDKIIPLILGPQWMESIGVFRMLGPAAFIGTFNVATGWVYVSLGRTDRQLRLALVLTPLTVGAFLVGLRWGILGVAAAFSISQLVLRLPGVAYCFRGTPLRLSDLGAALWRPTCASLLAGAVTAAVTLSLAVEGSLVTRLLIDIGVYAIALVASWLIVPGGWRTLVEMGGLLSELRPSKLRHSTF